MSEPGWNDPPTFSYSALNRGGGGGGGRQTHLNKRVLHQINSPTSSHSPSPSLNPMSGPPARPPARPQAGPPVIKSTVSRGPPTNDEERVGGVAGPTSTPNDVIEESCDFNCVIESLGQLHTRAKQAMESRAAEEVGKRLEILEQQWKEGRLSEQVQRKMNGLTTALEGGDFSAADGIHVTLMVDHVTEVNQWMVGVKKLISALRKLT